MKREIEKLIAPAIEAAEKHLQKEGTIASQYNGYISSFGAAVMQSGLLPAIAFNEKTTSGSEEDRSCLMRAILQIIKASPLEKGETLIKYVLATSETERRAMRRDILNAATALKLAIRTFRLEKRDSSNGE